MKESITAAEAAAAAVARRQRRQRNTVQESWRQRGRRTRYYRIKGLSIAMLVLRV